VPAPPAARNAEREHKAHDSRRQGNRGGEREIVGEQQYLLGVLAA
tara:strand:- start:782 stop:916 length:135 start_codon:yes stop_codon:yes gene_type:complete